MPRISQTGVAHLALLLILLAGIVVSTSLVQQRTNISPRAECEEDCDEPEEDEPEDDEEPRDEEPADEEPADDSDDDGPLPFIDSEAESDTVRREQEEAERRRQEEEANTPSEPDPEPTDEAVAEPGQGQPEETPGEVTGDADRGFTAGDPDESFWDRFMGGVGDVAENIAEGVDDAVGGVVENFCEYCREDRIERDIKVAENEGPDLSLLEAFSNPEQAKNNQKSLARDLGLDEDADLDQIIEKFNSVANSSIRVEEENGEMVFFMPGGAGSRYGNSYNAAAITALRISPEGKELLDMAGVDICIPGAACPKGQILVFPKPPGLDIDSTPAPPDLDEPLIFPDDVTGLGILSTPDITDLGLENPCPKIDKIISASCETPDLNTRGAVVASTGGPNSEDEALIRLKESFPDGQGVGVDDLTTGKDESGKTIFIKQNSEAPYPELRRDDLIQELKTPDQMQPDIEYNYIIDNDGRIFIAEKIPGEGGVKHLHIYGKAAGIDSQGNARNPEVEVVQSGTVVYDSSQQKFYLDLESGTFAGSGETTRPQWNITEDNLARAEDIFENQTAIRPQGTKGLMYFRDSANISSSDKTPTKYTMPHSLDIDSGNRGVIYTSDGDRWLLKEGNDGNLTVRSYNTKLTLPYDIFKKGGRSIQKLDNNGTWTPGTQSTFLNPVLEKVFDLFDIKEAKAAGLINIDKPVKQEMIYLGNALDFVSNKLATEGEINADEIKNNIIKNLKIPQKGIKSDSKIWVSTDNKGFVNFNTKKSKYKLDANAIEGIDISIPEEFDLSKNTIIPVGITTGSGNIKKVSKDSLIDDDVVPGNISDISVKIVIFNDENGNGKWDRSENISPWAGLIFTLEDLNYKETSQNQPNSNLNSVPGSAEPVPFYKIYVPQ